jgi:type IV pilus assembly protein PilY1
MPITRTNLTALTDLATGVTLPNTSKGWYLDLGSDAANGIGWRLTLNPLAFNGVVAFAPLLTVGDACSPSGVSRFYAISFGNGKSALTPDGQAFVPSSSAITDLAVVSVDGTSRWLTGNVQGEVKKQNVKEPSSLGLRLLNWREVPTVD